MLVNCVAYKLGRKVADLTIEEISDRLAEPDIFVWVALKDPDDAELEVMHREFGLHALAVEDAKRGHQRPKIEEYGNSIFTVLHTVEFDANGELQQGEVDIFIGKNYALSVRRNTMQGFAVVRRRCEREVELLKNGSAFVLYAIMDAVVDRYFPVVDQLEEKLEEMEEKIFSKSTSARANIEALYDLKRQLMVVQHAVTSLFESVNKLHGHGGRVPPLCQNMQEYFRDVSDHVIRISKSVDNTREMVATAIQVNLSLIALADAEVTKKLTSYGALLAIPMVMTGIYGMNFKFMPELDWEFGYPLMLLVMVIVNLSLWFKFRRIGWL